MKVIKATGLVPVRALIPYGNYGKGQVFGVSPEKARVGVEKGHFELVPIPHGTDTFDAPDPLGTAAPMKPTAAKPKAVAAVKVDIPQGWDKPQIEGGMHRLQKLRVAKMIKPDADNGRGWTVALAEQVIKEELARRAAAEKTAPAA